MTEDTRIDFTIPLSCPAQLREYYRINQATRGMELLVPDHLGFRQLDIASVEKNRLVKNNGELKSGEFYRIHFTEDDNSRFVLDSFAESAWLTDKTDLDIYNLYYGHRAMNMPILGDIIRIYDGGNRVIVTLSGEEFIMKACHNYITGRGSCMNLIFQKQDSDRVVLLEFWKDNENRFVIRVGHEIGRQNIFRLY